MPSVNNSLLFFLHLHSTFVTEFKEPDYDNQLMGGTSKAIEKN